MGITIVSAIVVFILGLMLLNFLMPEITTFRTNMECSSASTITDGTKLLCLTVDTTVPYWILLVFSILVGSIAARMYL